MAYLTLAQFKQRTTIPGEFIDELEALTPGWIDEQVMLESSRLNARLAKRYATPFVDPCPIIVSLWLVRIISVSVWLKRGVNALDEQFAEYTKERDNALAEIKEAGDSEVGLFELPLRADTDAGGVSRGFPRAYSEQSPYAWRDQQAAIGRNEDAAKSGSYK